jgi:hypothetical protein
MENASACTVCNEKTHNSRKCPNLYDVLKGGFHSGGGGGGGHGHDEEDQVSMDIICEISKKNIIYA